MEIYFLLLDSYKPAPASVFGTPWVVDDTTVNGGISPSSVSSRFVLVRPIFKVPSRFPLISFLTGSLKILLLKNSYDISVPITSKKSFLLLFNVSYSGSSVRINLPVFISTRLFNGAGVSTGAGGSAGADSRDSHLIDRFRQ